MRRAIIGWHIVCSMFSHWQQFHQTGYTNQIVDKYPPSYSIAERSKWFPTDLEVLLAGPTGNLRNLNRQKKSISIENCFSTALHLINIHGCLQGEKSRRYRSSWQRKFPVDHVTCGLCREFADGSLLESKVSETSWRYLQIILWKRLVFPTKSSR